MFESLITSNATLTPVQKLHYLRSTLSAEAVKIVNSLELTNNSYEIAWNLLKHRFKNKKLIVQYLIQNILELASINKESHYNLRRMVDSISQCVQTLHKLEQPVDS